MKIRCPVCGGKLHSDGKTAVCENRHAFDYAKSGYLNLLISNKKNHGDSPESVKARTAFLEKGYYGFLRDTLKEMIDALPHTVLADLGSGEGYYTKAFPADQKYGFDLSKAALAHAAKHDKSTAYIIASIFDLPFEDNTADIVVTCFAPPALDEILRILKPGGIFLYVTPGPKHLFEMKEAVYEQPYMNVTKPLLTPLLCIDQKTIADTFEISGPDAAELFRMTPYAYRTAPDAADRLAAYDQFSLTAEFVIRSYQKQ